MKELYNYLNSVSPIRADTWNTVKMLFTETTLKKGAFFIKEGDYAKRIGFLNNGIVRAFYKNIDGAIYNKHFFTPQNLIGGYASLVTKQQNKINLQALTDCELLTASYEELIDVYDYHQDFERFGRKLAESFFVHKEQREVEIVTLDADERYRIFQNQFPMLEQLIPQYHIASYLGITPTQLSRIRKKLAQK